MNIIGIIPARMASSRFPGKPLVPILGIPMIGHVYYRTSLSKLISEVYVATCDSEICHYADSINAKCIMTSSKHERATDRIAEAVHVIEKNRDRKIDAVVMVQGDEPLLDPQTLDDVAGKLLSDDNIKIANLIERISNVEDFLSKNVVKVVIDRMNQALYFSREPIPYQKNMNTTFELYKQTGLIAFRRGALQQYAQMEPTLLETQESIDMLRVIEHGEKITTVLSRYRTRGVDIPSELEVVEKIMASDLIYHHYKKEK